MAARERFDIKISFKNHVQKIGQFFKRNLSRLLSFFVLSLTSTLLLSFGIYTSSSSSIDSVAISASNIAKDNSYGKVHFETRLSFFSDGTLSENSKRNGKVFTKAHKIANQSFLRYSSAAFLTRNNFYNIPVDGESDVVQHIVFDYSFLSTNFSLKNITPSTSSEIVKKYTTSKYVDGVLDNDYSAIKMRMETIDLFLLSVTEKQAAGYPVYLPDYVANQIVDENDDINSLKDCLGLEGTIVVSGVTSQVYIKNIIVTSPKKGDPHILDDCDFTENNVRFAKFLKQLYGDYSLMFFSPMYSQYRCMTCADFDSEYFKIKSYLTNDLVEMYSLSSVSSVYSFEKDGDSFALKQNEKLSHLTNETLFKRLKNGNFSYFDGNIAPLIIGFILFAGALVLLVVFFGLRRFQKERLSWHFLLATVIPFLIFNSFSLLFLFFFNSKQAFVGFYFGSLSIVVISVFLIEFMIATIIYLLRRNG